MIEGPSIITTVLAFLVALGSLVFIHEFGHYYVGRLCGVKADVFSIGFGKSIAGWRDKRGTQWKIGWLPLGGYVQFAGDMNPVSQADPAWVALPEAERNQTFQAQPLWQRAAIVFAGPAINFLFAILILSAMAMSYGDAATPPVVSKVIEGSAAQAAGLEIGDRILSVDGRAMDVFDDIPLAVAHRPNEPINLIITRNGNQQSLRITPKLVTEKDRFGNTYERGLIGIAPGKVEVRSVSLIDAPGVAIRKTGQIIRQTVEVLGQIVTGRRSVKDLGGPLKIAKASGEQAEKGVPDYIFFVALLSINLGFINLLPLPMLDGGHLMFYAVEAVRRKPANARVQEWAFRAGFALVAVMMLVVTFNDLGSFGLWSRLGAMVSAG
jgi:regulator of sigma E protease